MQPTITNHIVIRYNRRGEPRAYVVGTRVRVQDVVNDYERHGASPEEIASQYSHISLAQVHACLAYYFENQAQIQAWMKSDSEYAALVEKQFDSESDVDSDSFSS